MGTKSSKLSMRNLKLETSLGSFGCSSCKSTCCITDEKEEEEQQKDPKLIYIEKVIKFELKTLEHLLLRKMISHYQEGKIPSISFKDEGETSVKIDLENPKPLNEIIYPAKIQKLIDEQKQEKV